MNFDNTLYSIQDLIEKSLEDPEVIYKLCEFDQDEENGNGPIYFKVSVSRLELDGSQRQMVKLVDVTDTVNYDLSKEQNELLSLINATVSHELRNPLNAIIS